MTLMSPTLARPGLVSLVHDVRAAVGRRAGWERTATLVADVLRWRLPGPDVLSERERAGDPASYQSHLLHVEPDGAFSVVAVVWRPGQVTAIHDHVTWCVVGVVQGMEREELFASRSAEHLVPAEHLVAVGDAANPEGSVTGFAPPGDIHRVRNPTHRTTVSLHVYGTDIARVGSSVRRTYDLPIRSG
jgi:3-mercaptopropionate dioxygenase